MNRSTEEPVGRVVGLFRYPVKSMGGEESEVLHLTETGVIGDRAYALQDAETGHTVSAKRPNKWPGILGWRAAFASDPEAGRPLPPLEIRLPTDAVLTIADPTTLEAEASRALGTRVTLEQADSSRATYEYHWPDMDGLVYQGRTYRDEITAHKTPPGTFFDSSMLHILTTASLEEMRRLAAPSRFERERFRPNILIESLTAKRGFVENEWIGGELMIGGTARVRIPGPCLRCVMVNLSQGSIPADPQILKSVFKHNNGNLGVKSEIATAGPVSVGDVVHFRTAS